MIWVDTRERDLIAYLDVVATETSGSGGAEVDPEAPPFRVANLPIGDVILTRATDAASTIEELNRSDILVIIERKTVADLAASIRDGRYEEQAFRLNDVREVNNHQILYMVEGDPNRPTGGNAFSKNKIGPDTVYATFASILFFKGFSLYNSRNLQDSGRFVWNTHRKLLKDMATKGRAMHHGSAPMGDAETGGANYDEACSHLTPTLKKKSAYASDAGLGAAMLCQIPGISGVIANALIAEFGSVRDLIDALRDEPKRVAAFRVGPKDAHARPRRLSKTVVDHMQRLLGK